MRTGERTALVGLPGTHPYGRLCDIQIFDDPRDPTRQEAITAAALRLERVERISGVISFDEKAVSNAAAVARSLGLPALTAEAALAARDKELMRHRFTAAGLKSPDFRRVSSREELALACNDIQFPLIVKPLDQGGSVGVRLAVDERELMESWAFARAAAKGGPVLVEEFVDGTEVSVETMTFAAQTRCVAITDKTMGPRPYFAEYGHAVPAQLPGGLADLATDTAHRAVEALGITVGAAHVELRLNERGAVMMEVGARLAGGLIPDVVELALGVDLYAAAIDCARGIDPAENLKATKSRAAGIRYLTPPKGRVTGLPSLDALRAVGKRVSDLEILPHVGERLPEVMHDGHLQGYVLAVDDSYLELQKRLTWAIGKVAPTIGAEPADA
jgi:biotin carboxylase